jgi:ATP-dependent DNA helicase RecQ
LKEVLRKYWGYDEFRPLQQDIIQAVLDKRDAVALLPTGGGKSICFQVPALMMDGVCLVISPLVALMKDQVEQLQKRGISAAFLHSGMDRKEMKWALNDIKNNRYKLVYISPERLKTQAFIDHLPNMKISFVAIDEAHCISQWGHDFRPEYMQINAIREVHPKLSFLALTASATLKVLEEIQTSLGMKTPAVFRKSFSRENLNYLVYFDEDKHGKMLKICKNVPGTGIVYVRNRRKTKEIADYLQNFGIVAKAYHAGLSFEERSTVQNEWISNKTRVVVATNAFGMGIDKPDVRFVIHLEIPDGIEAYYQEAGRAGRDGRNAYCVLLHFPGEEKRMFRYLEDQHPSLSVLNTLYQSIGNYCELAIQTGQFAVYPFNIQDFAIKFDLKPSLVFYGLKQLSLLGLLQFNEAVHASSKIKMEATPSEVYKFQVEHEQFDTVLKIVLRSYGGVFDSMVSISEELLAEKLKISKSGFIQKLRHLEKLQIISYLPQNKTPTLTWLEPRQTEVRDNGKILASNKLRMFERLEAMVHYTEAESCRNNLICVYFGENIETTCGKCDVCRLQERQKFSIKQFQRIEKNICETLLKKSMTVADIVESISDVQSEDLMKVAKWLLDDDVLELTTDRRLKLKSRT